jgi:SAM-dependent methyltransferase
MMRSSIGLWWRRAREQARERSHRLKLKEILRGAGGKTSHDLFSKCDEDFWLWVNTVGYAESAPLREVLPSLPSEEIQYRFTGLTGFATLRAACTIYTAIREIARRHGVEVSERSKILDFGCGWGRVLRFFLKDVEPEMLWGCDCSDIALKNSVETNRWCNFRLVDTLPPTSYPDQTFDLIYSYSVFSHLSEEAHFAWLKEFKRIMKPGGLLIATTRAREMIDYCGTIRTSDDLSDPHLRGLATAFAPTNYWKAKYDEGQYCHSPLSGGDVLDSSFYGETCISKTYVLKHWAEHFTFLEYVEDRKISDQNVIVVKS